MQLATVFPSPQLSLTKEAELQIQILHTHKNQISHKARRPGPVRRKTKLHETSSCFTSWAGFHKGTKLWKRASIKTGWSCVRPRALGKLWGCPDSIKPFLDLANRGVCTVRCSFANVYDVRGSWFCFLEKVTGARAALPRVEGSAEGEMTACLHLPCTTTDLLCGEMGMELGRYCPLLEEVPLRLWQRQLGQQKRPHLHPTP